MNPEGDHPVTEPLFDKLRTAFEHAGHDIAGLFDHPATISTSNAPKEPPVSLVATLKHDILAIAEKAAQIDEAAASEAEVLIKSPLARPILEYAHLTPEQLQPVIAVLMEIGHLFPPPAAAAETLTDAPQEPAEPQTDPVAGDGTPEPAQAV